MLLRGGKTCIDLCFVFKRLASSRKVEKKLAVKFEQAQISRKLTQATTSHRKLAVKRGTSMHKQKLAITCVLSRLIRA